MTAIWWQFPSMTAIQGLWCCGPRRCASANASAMTSPAGLRTDANSVFPLRFRPGCGFHGFLSGAGRAEQGSQDVFRDARRGRDIGYRS